MSELLESVKTDQLKNAYNKFLPNVLNETGSIKAASSRENLTENRKSNSNSQPLRTTVEATGNRINRLATSAQAEASVENQANKELKDFLFLAGVKS
jgi:hypothetical protein